MALVWNFASPLAIEMLAQNKFLFTVPLQSHVDHIMNQGPWNIRGSLLLLQPWSSNLTLEEIELHICPFLVQLHGLPMQNMTTQNAIRIGKAIGSVFEVENCDNKGIICRQYLQVKVELNTSLPLIPRFHIPRNDKESLWVSFKYERLADYCTLCGLIGHKNFRPCLINGFNKAMAWYCATM
jgi:hypothetical protein